MQMSGMDNVHPGQRVAVLADSQNLYHTARSLYSRNIDYAALLEAAVDDRQLTRAIAYVIKADARESVRPSTASSRRAA